MTLKELKDFIKAGIRPSDFMIFVRKDNNFLVNQYVQALGKMASGGIKKIKSIYEPQQSTMMLLTSSEDTLNVVVVESFDERAEDYLQFENTVVVCDQVDKNIVKAVENYTIKFPKLEEWQIYDYAKTLCPTVEDGDLMWLVKATNSNIERVLNELDKVSLFSKEEQKDIFTSIRFDPQTDLYNVDLFTIVNALVNGDNRVLFDFLKYNDYETLEPVMLANRALISIKNILLISQNPSITADAVGVSAGQYKYIKYNYRSLDVIAAKQKLKFLTKFDLDLKTSRLDISKRDMLNYLINHLNYRITM